MGLIALYLVVSYMYWLMQDDTNFARALIWPLTLAVAMYKEGKKVIESLDE